MALTIQELTEIPFLRTELFAGAAGAGNAISWAHSNEMTHPWEWLDPGDLLMTVGMGIPTEAGEQVEWVEALAKLGVSGVAIGADMLAPSLSEAMIAAADRLGLPLLWTPIDVPFTSVARTVAAAVRGPEHLQLIKTVRLYDSLRAAAIRSSSPAELIQVLGREIECELWVISDAAQAVLPETDAPRPEVVEGFAAVMAKRGSGVPGILRFPVGERTALVVPVPARRAASLVALPRASEMPTYAILEHVATIAALEVERLLARREEMRRLGSETLARLLDGRLTAESAVPQLELHGLGAGPFVLAICHREDAPGGWVHHQLAERGVANMLHASGEVLFGLIGAEEATVAELLDVLDLDGTTVGVSDQLDRLDALPNAVLEARWALDTARADGRRSARYGERMRFSGPRSAGEVRDLVDRLLGPVIRYDAERGTDLLNSLTVFMRCNRSWQQAAAELYVHKQTLIYRMRRVEELTGLKLNETEAIAELWPAIQALELLR
jgi:purine catabolism regulator